MRNQNEYPEYEGIRAQFGDEAALQVGTLIHQGHTGLMATVNRISQQAGELSLVVTANLLSLLAMENSILVRAMQIMDPNSDRQDPISPEEFGAALIEAQRQLQAEAMAQRGIVDAQFEAVADEPVVPAMTADAGPLTAAEAEEQAEHPVPGAGD